MASKCGLLVIFLLGFQLVACSHFSPPPTDKLANSLEPRTERGYYQLSYHRFTHTLKPVNDNFADDGLSLIFPLISGSIFGEPSEVILGMSAAHDGRFRLNIPQQVDTLAKPFDQGGLDVQPENTRVLRMGTFHSYPYYQTLGDGGFINGRNGNALVFVYFSQAASISGELKQFGDSFTYSVKVEEPGWQWLEIANNAQRSYQVTNYTGSSETIYFAVLIDEMTAI